MSKIAWGSFFVGAVIGVVVYMFFARKRVAQS